MILEGLGEGRGLFLEGLFTYNILLLKFKISSTFFALVALCCGKIGFFRNVVFGRLPASILEGFGLDLDGFGRPS